MPLVCYSPDMKSPFRPRRTLPKISPQEIDTGFAGSALYRVERLMKNTFPTVSHASFRARRGDRLAGFRAMAAWLTIFTLAGTAGAATLTVTNLNDSGAGSLRDSIASASAGDKIQFQVTGTIALTSGQLTIGRNLTISGPGPSQLAINGNHASRVFEIAAGATVSLSGLTVENGFQYEIAIYGGGILNRGTLTATNCTITGNSLAGFGAAGGGIANLGQLTLDGSSVTGNSTMIGAGIVNFYKGTVKNSTVSGNSASTSGGGISNWGSQGGASDTSLTVTNSTLSGNSAGSGRRNHQHRESIRNTEQHGGRQFGQRGRGSVLRERVYRSRQHPARQQYRRELRIDHPDIVEGLQFFR